MLKFQIGVQPRKSHETARREYGWHVALTGAIE
jgi:hypothetical protein